MKYLSISKEKINKHIKENGIESLGFYLDEIVENKMGILEFQIEFDYEDDDFNHYKIIEDNTNGFGQCIVQF